MMNSTTEDERLTAIREHISAKYTPRVREVFDLLLKDSPTTDLEECRYQLRVAVGIVTQEIASSESPREEVFLECTGIFERS